MERIVLIGKVGGEVAGKMAISKFFLRLIPIKRVMDMY